MAASGAAVSVLTPNGRRQTVKVSPNTPLLQVLEDVCKKHSFNPDEYGLKFQRSVLDLTLQWRFASLPNNAKLEVVPCSRHQPGAESVVRIALQLEDGSRLQGNFSSGQTLWDLLTHFPQIRPSEVTPVCVYMRDEICGEAALKKTSLKSLGLTGGSAIIRYVLKTASAPDDLTDAVAKATASPSLPPETSILPVSVETPAPPPEATPPVKQTLPVKQEEEDPKKVQEQSVRPKTRPGAERRDLVTQTDEERPGTSQQQHGSTHPATPTNFVPFSGGGQRLGGAGGSGPKTPTSWTLSVSASPPKAKKPKPNHEVKSVEREPLIFHLDSGSRRHDDSELPDEFFEVTVDDVRKRFAQLKSERRALEESPLMTKSLREAQMKEKLDRYPKVVLRVQFPDRRVLQGFFTPLETIGDLRHFITSHLQDPQMKFYLFVAPPKTILEAPSVTLFQASLFPAAVVYFGSDVRTECYLRSDLLDGSVSAQLADEVITGCMPRSPPPVSSSVTSEDVLEDDVSSCGSSGQQSAVEDESDSQSSAHKPVKTDPSQVPKWLKLPGKK
ncbi:Tether containing UBX domain for GLUT4 [Triplophysa tibetana]|uniref:Tether containing UBX domain for GLUT4 n=1 Tax=Triplophysa tibetana TaxID=1572043 RepID=A0A5A9MRW6_9TELE|nr:Tether containing UBX domain for GLUT4 [Triplophysa tibetana]